MRTKERIKQDIEETKRRLEELEAELRDLEYKKRSSRSDSYKKRKEMLEAASEHIKKVLEVGMFIKVTGSRAGSLKEIIYISPTGDQVTVNPCWVKRIKNADGSFEDRVQSDISRVTEHSTNKITEVYIDGRWKKAKEFLDD